MRRGVFSTYTGILIGINVVGFILALVLMNAFDEAVVVNSNNKFYGLKLDNEILPHIHFENGDAVNIRMNKYLGKIYRSNNH